MLKYSHSSTGGGTSMAAASAFIYEKYKNIFKHKFKNIIVYIVTLLRLKKSKSPSSSTNRIFFFINCRDYPQSILEVKSPFSPMTSSKGQPKYSLSWDPKGELHHFLQMQGILLGTSPALIVRMGEDYQN